MRQTKGRYIKKLTALLLSAVLLFSSFSFPAPVYAADYDENDGILDFVINTISKMNPLKIGKVIAEEYQKTGFSAETALNLGTRYVDSLIVSTDALFNSLKNELYTPNSAWANHDREVWIDLMSIALDDAPRFQTIINDPNFSVNYDIDLTPYDYHYYENSNVTNLSPGLTVIDGYMPDVTIITNIEYETLRKFYSKSDNFIDAFKTLKRDDAPLGLSRLFKILDNRSIFTDYLTSVTFAFRQCGKDEEGKQVYLNWWKRLKMAKQGGIKADCGLLREYAQKLDESVIKARTVSAIESAAVYNDDVTTSFAEDYAAFAANLNKSDVKSNDHGREYHARVTFYDKYGEVVTEVLSDYLTFYQQRKTVKANRLKNRKKNQNSLAEQAA
ncbi:hypothetical protein FACS189490_10350 [Clostridia bacterium]|nr:hypothetical protein FACS189490_10350 [Clostridia bacterium]